MAAVMTAGGQVTGAVAAFGLGVTAPLVIEKHRLSRTVGDFDALIHLTERFAMPAGPGLPLAWREASTSTPSPS